MDSGAATNTRRISPARYNASVMAMLVIVFPVPISMSRAASRLAASPSIPSKPQAKL
jgi:hypothetical protein